MEQLEELRERVERFMYDRNMTLIKAASFFEVSIGTLSLFLNGKTNPHGRTKYRLRKRMGEIKES